MLKIKVIELSGASVEYINDGEILNRLHLMGHGLPEREEIDQDGNPTGVMLPAEYTIEIHDVTFDYELDLCIKSRVAEYPNLGDFLNAFFDGGEPALAELQAKRLAVKAKYPKPIQGGN
jgi:hypothetical protein